LEVVVVPTARFVTFRGVLDWLMWSLLMVGFDGSRGKLNLAPDLCKWVKYLGATRRVFTGMLTA
jgi:hypothetical protein